jgi:Apea-like HEPN
MTDNLLRDRWTDLDSGELRLLLKERIPGPGQYHDRSKNPNTLYLPLAGSSCRIGLTFRDKKIVTVEPGPAFDAAEWEQISADIEKSILAGPLKIGREYSFSSFPVPGSWRGDRSGVQILPPPDDAPRVDIETAKHPFILEFPIQASDFWHITNHRRLRAHRNLTLLLNVLLAGGTSLQPRRPEHFWAVVPSDDDPFAIKWVQEFYFAKLGEAVSDELSPPAGGQLEDVEPEEYHTKVGHDGRGLRVPTDLDQSICLYQNLSLSNRAKFDRAAFWMDMASHQWNISVSASVVALVSAIESLTVRGDGHHFTCPVCGGTCQHEVPGATERFRAFFENHAPGAALRSRRTEMYGLRSRIVHGSELMQLDQDFAFGGWDPPWQNEDELHRELWGITRLAVRNWLKNPPAT